MTGGWPALSLLITVGTRFSTELSNSSGAPVPTTLKKRSDVPKLSGDPKNLLTSSSAASFEAPYGDIGFLRSSSLTRWE